MPRALAAACIWFILTTSAFSQTFDFQTDPQSIILLNGLWRFHTGDDPRWADPNYKDQDWSLLRSDRSWTEQGYKNYGGIAWYRFRVKNLGHQGESLYVGPIVGSYQVFANGQFLGGVGTMPPHAAWYGYRDSLFKVPEQPSASEITIAIRIWADPRVVSLVGAGPGGGAFGEARLVQRHADAYHYFLIWIANRTLILSVLGGLAGLAALALFAMRRSEYEYLWFAVVQLSNCAAGCFTIYFSLNSFPGAPWTFIETSLGAMSGLAASLFYLCLFRRQRSWLFWTAMIALVVLPLPYYLYRFGWLIGQPYWAFEADLTFVGCLWFASAIWGGRREKLPYARLLLIPVSLQALENLAVIALTILHPGQYPSLLSVPLDSHVLEIYAGDIESFLFIIIALVVLLARFAQTRRGEEHYASELEAARTVQKVLVPEDNPEIPGFSITSVYQPAQEVGGDFFQIIPLATGVMIAVGDVSGKGLPAAMTVSLIVGALRMVAERTSSPAAILNGLNRRLIGRGMGFTTCLVMVLELGGSGLISGAGHPPPYRNGEEMAVHPNLPLGLSADIQYSESTVNLQAGDRLTFLSDGVVEARNTQGELYGFDRTRLSSTQSAHEIVAAAKQFGQEDDITVLTMQYLGMQKA